MNKSKILHEFTKINRILRRYKSKQHWASKKLFPKDRALEQFDDFYGNVYGNDWKSIRVALLSEHKYCAVVNNFGDTEKTIQNLENNGAINVRALYEVNRQNYLEKSSEKVEKIYKLDNTIDKFKDAKIQKDFENIYGENEINVRDLKSEEPSTAKVEEPEIKRDLSLQKSLDSAQIDYSRIINPDVGLSGSALYEYIPATKLKGMEDWILESDHYRYYETSSEFSVKIVKENKLNFPEHLHIYSYDRGNISHFPSVRKCSTGVLDKYLLDGGSILPVLALDLQPKDHVLDMCAAPGGKSLMIMQSLLTDYLVCNDLQESRSRRVINVFKQYLYDYDRIINNKLVITNGDARGITESNVFDKILVDVPCTTDRHVVMENDNNIFKPTRIKERLRLPELQAALLTNALKLVKPGGTVVYSTCSLSPIQNDGVVHMALKKIWQETNFELTVSDLSEALKPMNCLFKINDRIGLKYGHIVVPFLPNNFGPMNFCKINKNIT
ncbi:5-methylcytosine rRNA methyltransferase NSUN4 [Chrysoperla carnea]|uniref:5-methylcytosine rRNA methyltransferase NSUN4 n=1 Tax=Chrysoperla carnea TaxID=189513 RepID=UPI001D05CE49|nr:5-methylcytosine rRNA methyltransferase NSUN4 [Chrysoperla carnea]